MNVLTAAERDAIDLYVTALAITTEWRMNAPDPDDARMIELLGADEWAEYCADYDQADEDASHQVQVDRLSGLRKLLAMHDVGVTPTARCTSCRRSRPLPDLSESGVCDACARDRSDAADADYYARQEGVEEGA